MYNVVPVWTVLAEDGMYGDIYESIEMLVQFEGDAANIEQGYIIVDDYSEMIAEGTEDFYTDYYDAMMDMARLEGGVFVCPDCIAIYDVDEEIVFWDKTEWEEDSTVTTAIANAIRIFYEEGSMALKEVIGRV